MVVETVGVVLAAVVVLAVVVVVVASVLVGADVVALTDPKLPMLRPLFPKRILSPIC